MVAHFFNQIIGRVCIGKDGFNSIKVGKCVRGYFAPLPGINQTYCTFAMLYHALLHSNFVRAYIGQTFGNRDTARAKKTYLNIYVLS